VLADCIADLCIYFRLDWWWTRRKFRFLANLERFTAAAAIDDSDKSWRRRLVDPTQQASIPHLPVPVHHSAKVLALRARYKRPPILKHSSTIVSDRPQAMLFTTIVNI
jgi:hypothetical protein